MCSSANQNYIMSGSAYQQYRMSGSVTRCIACQVRLTTVIGSDGSAYQQYHISSSVHQNYRMSCSFYQSYRMSGSVTRFITCQVQLTRCIAYQARFNSNNACKARLTTNMSGSLYQNHCMPRSVYQIYFVARFS